MSMHSETLRIDKLLWYLRLAKSRRSAQALIASGHVRIDGRRIEKPHFAVRANQVITLPLGNSVRVIRVAVIPHRRGPAPEAQSCYCDIGAGPLENTIAV